MVLEAVVSTARFRQKLIYQGARDFDPLLDFLVAASGPEGQDFESLSANERVASRHFIINVRWRTL